MKQIDVDRLKAEIHHLKIDVYDEAHQFDIGARNSLTFLESFIDSIQQEDISEVSDGYHTFNELYYYRMLYNAAFFNLLPKEWVHKSKRHHDGEECFGGGWFIVMANLPTGQISNHYELKDWDLFQIPEKEIADEWDGHTPQEAADRLYKYLRQEQPDVNLEAEKDLALTWKDMKRISRILDIMVDDDFKGKIPEEWGEEEYYKEVLRRFNKEKEE